MASGTGFFNYPTEPTEPAIDSGDNLVFLSHWDGPRWAKFRALCGLRRFAKGEILIAVGEEERSFFILTAGRVEVIFHRLGSAQPHSSTVLETGVVIGEQAFLDGRPRSASVRALTDGQMVVVNQTAFEILSVREPDMARDLLFDLARILSLKLRLTNEFMSRTR